ncbi:hypothetical protein SNE40_022875 [Patella caerulea]|uniref:Uncharacterized protein n=1 Tax=Patella caerulea TaxID=87958 RepID=A0AAN8GGT5_PATCE
MVLPIGVPNKILIKVYKQLKDGTGSGCEYAANLPEPEYEDAAIAMDTSGDKNKDCSAHDTTNAAVIQHDSDEVHCLRLEIAEVQASLADIQNKLSSQNNGEHAVTREIGNGIPVDAELENSNRSISMHLPAALNSSHSSVPSGMGLSNHRVPEDSLPPVNVVPQHIR